MLWKGVIEDLAKDFLHFFYEPFLNQMDLTKPIHFMDQELSSLFHEAKSKHRFADKLMRIQLKDGQ